MSAQGCAQADVALKHSQGANKSEGVFFIKLLFKDALKKGNIS